MARRKRNLSLSGSVQMAAPAEGTPGRRFSMVAYSGGTFSQWWSRSPLVLDLDTLRLPVSPLPILYDHRPDAQWVAGRTESVWIENGQVLAKGPVYESTEGGQQVLLLGDEGHTWQSSIGADIGRLEEVKAGAKVVVNGIEYVGPVDVARDVELREISFVVIGAAKNTSAVVARGGHMDFETWCISKGFNAADLDEVQRANMQQMYDEQVGSSEEGEGETDEPTPPAPPAAAAEGDTDTEEEEEDEEPVAAKGTPRILASRRHEAEEIIRVDKIRRLCAKANNPRIKSRGQDIPLAAHAIEQGWPVMKVENHLLRTARPRAGDHLAAGNADRGGRSERDQQIAALQGALLLRAGGRLDHPSYTGYRAVAMRIPQWLRLNINHDTRQRAMEAAHRFASLSLVDLCREAVRLDGRDAPHARNEMIQAAFSGSALNDIFTTNINALLLSTYEEAPDTTSGWVRETETGDFKTMSRMRMVKGGRLTKLPRGGTADHGNRSDVAESYKIARYAQQFQIDEQDVIDDYFGALADLPVEMANAAARLRPDLVYSILKANAALDADSTTLFHANHSNTAGSAALTPATLKTGVTAIRIQQENGVNLNLQPTHLIVPSTLDFAAREYVASTVNVIAGTAGSITERGDLNTLASVGLQVVSDARLDNGVTDPEDGTSHAGDTNDWFLAAAGGYGIEVCYLRDTGRAPQVRSFVLDRGQWGIGYDVKFDIGAKSLDYRGLYRGQG